MLWMVMKLRTVARLQSVCSENRSRYTNSCNNGEVSLAWTNQRGACGHMTSYPPIRAHLDKGEDPPVAGEAEVGLHDTTQTIINFKISQVLHRI